MLVIVRAVHAVKYCSASGQGKSVHVNINQSEGSSYWPAALTSLLKEKYLN